MSRLENNTDWVWCSEHPKTAARFIDEQSTEINTLQTKLEQSEKDTVELLEILKGFVEATEGADVAIKAGGRSVKKELLKSISEVLATYEEPQ